MPTTALQDHSQQGIFPGCKTDILQQEGKKTASPCWGHSLKGLECSLGIHQNSQVLGISINPSKSINGIQGCSTYILVAKTWHEIHYNTLLLYSASYSANDPLVSAAVSCSFIYRVGISYVSKQNKDRPTSRMSMTNQPKHLTYSIPKCLVEHASSYATAQPYTINHTCSSQLFKSPWRTRFRAHWCCV